MYKYVFGYGYSAYNTNMNYIWLVFNDEKILIFNDEKRLNYGE